MASRKKQSTNISEQPDNLVELVKIIANKITSETGTPSNTKSDEKKFSEFAQMVADRVSEKKGTKTGAVASGSSKTSDFQGEAISLLRRIDENIKKNDIPKFIESKLSSILHKAHQENVIWDENRSDNRATSKNNKQTELIEALKELKTNSPSYKPVKKENDEAPNGAEKNGGIISKLGGLLTGGIAGIGTLLAGSIFGGGALYHLTGADNPNEVQSATRGITHFGLRAGGKKLTQLSSKLGTKQFSALRQLAKSPASKIIRESTKKMTKMLPSGGVAGKLTAPAKSILGRAGKIAGVGKAISKTGIKGVAKAGKLASKAKWLGKAAKLSKFGGKLLPGVGTALSVWETVGHIKNGNYGRAALSGISAVGSLIPGVGTVVSGVADAIGTGWDIFSAWKRRKSRKQEEKAEQVKKENRQQKETVQQMTAKTLAKTEAKGASQVKSDKMGAMASKVDAEIKKTDKPQPKKQSSNILKLAKTAFKYTTPVGLGLTAWKNRKKIGKTITGTTKKIANSKIGKLAKTAFKYTTPVGLGLTAWKNRDKIGESVKTLKDKALTNAKKVINAATNVGKKASALASVARTKAKSIVKSAVNNAKETIKTVKKSAPAIIKKASGIANKILPFVPGIGLPLTAASALWKNRKKISGTIKSIKSKAKNAANKIGNTSIGKTVKKLADNKLGRVAKTIVSSGSNIIRATNHQNNQQVHPQPTVTAIKEKPQITQRANIEESETSKLGNIVTDQLTKTRDADAAQAKDITETFKTELEKVCAMLAQISGTLPSLQPAPPPPVQQVMEGNKVPEFRKHNLEAIA